MVVWRVSSNCPFLRVCVKQPYYNRFDIFCLSITPSWIQSTVLLENHPEIEWSYSIFPDHLVTRIHLVFSSGNLRFHIIEIKDVSWNIFKARSIQDFKRSKWPPVTNRCMKRFWQENLIEIERTEQNCWELSGIFQFTFIPVVSPYFIH